jgi:allantoin racemase
VTRRRHILLINPNTSASITAALVVEARRLGGDKAEVEGVTAPFGSAVLECRAELVVAAHAVLEAIAAHTHFDAAVIGAFGDPGLEAAQDIAQAPVFGLGRSGLGAAAAAGRRFAIVTIGAQMRREIERAVAGQGLSNQLVAIRFLEGAVLEVARDRGAFSEALVGLANACVKENGAEAILLGGAPFAGMSVELAARIVVPVFDGLASAMQNALGAAPRAQVGRAMVASAHKSIVGVSPPLAQSIHHFLNNRS